MHVDFQKSELNWCLTCTPCSLWMRVVSSHTWKKIFQLAEQWYRPLEEIRNKVRRLMWLMGLETQVTLVTFGNHTV